MEILPIDWEALASIATAIAVFLGMLQLRESLRIRQAEYEDSFDQQYRALAMAIPVDALIGKPTMDHNRAEVRELIYNYLDLSNEQTYQRSAGRVGKRTWSDWSDGIQSNLSRPAFAEVWNEVRREAPGEFSFLEALEATGFAIDPKSRGFQVDA